MGEVLQSAHDQAGEAVRELRGYASRIELDPDAGRATEQRTEALHGEARKHRLRPAELPQLLQTLQARLAELELAASPEALQREVQAARARVAGRPGGPAAQRP